MFATRATFEWGDVEDTANVVKPGIDFEFAAFVFADADIVVVPTIRPEDGEMREKAIGGVEGDVMHIISARRANGQEVRIHGNR